jgi:SAM-dependent methyltransferase
MTFNPIEKQRRSFDRLVIDGVYSQSFDHSPTHKAFVQEVLETISPRLEQKKSLVLLDCGCGTGAWLAFLYAALKQQGFSDIRCLGFDLSGVMIEVARQKLCQIAIPEDIKEGDVLESASYRFPHVEGGVDLLFTYDVIQQLPRRQQYIACERMAEQLAPGGLALIFDNDSRSKFGRRMAKRKFLTRYFGLPLVPRYYCNASYPPLERFRTRLSEEPTYHAEIRVRRDQIKRVVIVENQANYSANSDNS